MSFRCDSRTLLRLEWPRLAECLAGQAATQRGAEACRADLFQPTKAAVRERQAETTEARRLVDAGFGNRILFGSDASLEDGIEAILEADFLTNQQKQDILCNNAARFLRLDDAICL